MSKKCYKRKPIGFKYQIPVFARNSFYKANYERISNDHLISEMECGKNPFNSETLLEELEKSTLDIIKKYNKKDFRILDAGLGNEEILSKLFNKKNMGWIFH